MFDGPAGWSRCPAVVPAVSWVPLPRHRAGRSPEPLGLGGSNPDNDGPEKGVYVKIYTNDPAEQLTLGWLQALANDRSKGLLHPDIHAFADDACGVFQLLRRRWCLSLHG